MSDNVMTLSDMRLFGGIVLMFRDYGTEPFRKLCVADVSTAKDISKREDILS